MDEMTGVNESVVAEQEFETVQDTAQEMTQEYPQNTGVETQPVAGANEGIEKAFAARLAKERERLEAEIRQKYESELKSHPTLTYLEKKAQSLGMTVEQLIENDRKYEEQRKLNELIQKNIPPEYAQKLLKVDELERWKQQTEQERQAEEQRRKQEEEKQQMYMEFFQLYPEFDSVEKLKEIPREVWEMVAHGKPLAAAYALYENKLLKQQYQTQQANQKNSESSTGSVKTHGNTGGYISREQFEANKSNMNWVMKNLDLIEQSRKHWK
jgi:hypothetical protein